MYYYRYLFFSLFLGPAECLFQKSYFDLMRTALKANGIICSQAGTAWANLDHVSQTMKHCRSTFDVAAYGIAAVPTYPTGQIGFVLGSSNPVSCQRAACNSRKIFRWSFILVFLSQQKETNFKEPVRIFTEDELEAMEMCYYSDRVHRAAFVLPRFAEKALKLTNWNRSSCELTLVQIFMKIKSLILINCSVIFESTIIFIPVKIELTLYARRLQ